MYHKNPDGYAPCCNTPVLTMSSKYPILSSTELEISPYALMKRCYEKETKVPFTSSYEKIGMPTIKQNCDCQKIAIKLIQICIHELSLLKFNKMERGVCEHCKLFNFKCKRCEYISKRKPVSRHASFDDYQIRLTKVNRIIESIFKSDTLCLGGDKLNPELSNLLKELRTSLLSLKLYFSTHLSNVDVDETVGILDSMLNSYTKEKSILDTTSFGQKKDLSPLIDSTEVQMGCPLSTVNDKTNIENWDIIKLKLKKQTSLLETASFEKNKDLSPQDPMEVRMRYPLSILNDKNNIVKRDIINKLPKKTANNKSNINGSNNQGTAKKNDIKQKSKVTEKENSVKSSLNYKKSDTPKSKTKSKQGSSSEELMKKMINDLKKEKDKNKIISSVPKENNVRDKSVIASLPELKFELSDKSDSVESGVVECHVKEKDPSKIIFGTKLVNRQTWKSSSKHVTAGRVKNGTNSTIDSNITESTNTDYMLPDESLISSTNVVSSPSIKKRKKKMIKRKLKPNLKFQLSDPLYIKKGWTQLPSEKIMEVCYIFQGIPAVNIKNDWFEMHSEAANYFYDDGNLLAKVEPPFGRWYYKSGRIALEHYKTDDGSTSNQRCVVYSSHYVKRNRIDQISVLALFDYLGNGIIYDQNGNERLKYNQNEGSVIDTKIGPAVGWKWHSTNTANELKTVFYDTILQNTDDNFKYNVKDDAKSIFTNDNADESMLEIEFETELKKLAKLNVKHRPAVFKPKIVKINDCFSLYMKDQQNITLRFNAYSGLMKLNLGIQIDESKIAFKVLREKSTKTVTPYDKFVPFAENLYEIEDKLEKLRIT